VLKTEGELQQRIRQLARPLALALLGVIIVVSLWTPYAHPEVAARWFSLPNMLFFAPVPLLVLFVTWATRTADRLPNGQAPPDLQPLPVADGLRRDP
jgi:cytochrome d ubiquinol oxidase subunit II